MKPQAKHLQTRAEYLIRILQRQQDLCGTSPAPVWKSVFQNCHNLKRSKSFSVALGRTTFSDTETAAVITGRS